MRKYSIPIGFFLVGVLVAANAAYADTLTYIFTGPLFNYAESPYTTQDRITGSVAFDRNLLDINGSGLIHTGLGQSFSWEFRDGFNDFNNNNTTPCAIEVTFSAFAVIEAFIDPTCGLTSAADIFVAHDQSVTAYVSFHDGACATYSLSGGCAPFGFSPTTPLTSNPWSAVPEPSSGFLMLSALWALAFAVRKRAAPVISLVPLTSQTPPSTHRWTVSSPGARRTRAHPGCSSRN